MKNLKEQKKSSFRKEFSIHIQIPWNGLEENGDGTCTTWFGAGLGSHLLFKKVAPLICRLKQHSSSSPSLFRFSHPQQQPFCSGRGGWVYSSCCRCQREGTLEATEQAQVAVWSTRRRDCLWTRLRERQIIVKYLVAFSI